MFRRQTLTLTFALLLGALWMVAHILPFSKQELAKLQDQVRGSETTGSGQVHPKRTGLRRDLVDATSHVRKHYSLTSAFAQTHLDLVHKQLDEELDAITLTIQNGEELWFLNADAAHYEDGALHIEGNIHLSGPKGTLEAAFITLEPHEEKHFQWRRILLEGDILFTSSSNTVVSAPLATYDLESGLLTLFDDVNVSTEEGSRLSAQNIECAPNSQAFTATKVKGLYPINDETVAELFAAQAQWFPEEETLVLEDDIFVDMGRTGSFSAQDRVIIQTHMENNQRLLTSLDIQGPSTLTYAYGEKKGTLHSPSHAFLDHNTGKATFFSDHTSGPVSFQSSDYLLHANTVTAHYLMWESQPSLEQIIAEGDVSLSTHPEGDVIQYALADRLEHKLSTKESILKAHPHKRTLLVDTHSGVAVSAPGIKLSVDPTSHQQRIQGLGDVRFTLLDREYQRIKERFNLGKLPL